MDWINFVWFRELKWSIGFLYYITGSYWCLIKKNSFFQTVVSWVLCNGGFGSASLLQSWRISEKPKMLWQWNYWHFPLFKYRGKPILHFGTATGGWVEAKLVSQVMPSDSSNDWTEKHRQASGHGRPAASDMYLKPFFFSYTICDDKRYYFPLQSLSLMSLHHNSFNNIAIIEVWPLHAKKREKELKDCVEEIC